MKRVYLIPLLLLLAVGLAVPLWHSMQGRLVQSQEQAPESPPRERITEQPGSESPERPAPDGEKAGRGLPGEKNAAASSGDREPLSEQQPQPAAVSAAGKQPDRSSPGEKPSPGSSSPEAASPGELTREEPPVGISADLAIVGRSGRIIFKREGITVSGGRVVDTLEAAGIAYETAYQGKLITSIGGLKNEGMSGWMYQINGETVMRSAAEQEIREGDCVIWWYSEKIDQEPPQWDEL